MASEGLWESAWAVRNPNNMCYNADFIKTFFNKANENYGTTLSGLHIGCNAVTPFSYDLPNCKFITNSRIHNITIKSRDHIHYKDCSLIGSHLISTGPGSTILLSDCGYKYFLDPLRYTISESTLKADHVKIINSDNLHSYYEPTTEHEPTAPQASSHTLTISCSNLSIQNCVDKFGKIIILDQLGIGNRILIYKMEDCNLYNLEINHKSSNKDVTLLNSKINTLTLSLPRYFGWSFKRENRRQNITYDQETQIIPSRV